MGNASTSWSRAGHSLMEAAVNQGIPGIRAECGGSCACATCHVIVDPMWQATVGPPHPAEDHLLELLERQDGSRLACQIKLREALAGLVVRVPGDSTG